MRSFVCDVCGQPLVFENTVCVHCGTPLGFSVNERRMVPAPRSPDGASGLRRCANQLLAACNWLVAEQDGDRFGGLCLCCRLTRTRPADGDEEGLAAFARTEAAKRRLVFQLLDLGLPVLPTADDPARGLAFDLLSSAQAPVVTGHADGVVTIDLAEGHDAHREAMRIEMAEPYRTLLGHLRHEVGHYYWTVLVQGNGLVTTGGAGVLDRARALFGDERQDYAEALRQHYGAGPPGDWRDGHVSAYAAAHPWEDWAETFAHYLHIRDTLQTAGSYGMVVTGPEAGRPQAVAALVALPSQDAGRSGDVEELVASWLPLTYALNAVNRSMGKDDLYPFVLTAPVIAKLALVHELVLGAAGPQGEPPGR